MSKNKYWEDFEDKSGLWNLRRQAKWFWQRLTRGFDDQDLWSLDRTIARFVYPRLEKFRTWQCEHGNSCPGDLDPASWLEVLNKMVLAFELLHDRDTGEEEVAPTPDDKVCWDIWVTHIQENDAKIKEGLALFGKYLPDLWD